jgi:cytoskeleton protein RodZ
MEEIGSKLRQAREQLGLTLEEAEHATRIRIHHLQALERGDMASLPSSAQARGFLRNYAEFLGLDPERLLIAYAESLQTRGRRPRAPRPASGDAQASVLGATGGLRRPRWFSLDLLVAAVITLGVIAVLIWGGGRVIATLGQQGGSEQGAGEFLIATLTASPTSSPPPASNTLASDTETPLPGEASPTLPPFIGPVSQVVLHIVVEKRAWLQVMVDGKVVYAGQAAPGQPLPDFQGQVIEVQTGNAGGLHIYANGQDQGLLGNLGQVVIQLWTLQGVVTPTPTATATVTVTPRFSATPTRTPLPTGNGAAP